MNNTREHNKLVDEILFECVKAYPKHCRIWSRRVGLALPWASYKAGIEKPVMYGVDGEADIQGYLKFKLPCVSYCTAVSERYLALGFAVEVKTGSGRLQENQELWRKMFLEMGGVYVEARSVKDALHGISLALGF